ncbi:MAG: ABC-F family ATP-binding cassette domain-containing protein [Anaerolineaceae bacterium]|nr:ABC-F family ATP-binding cassette domain-containing protein [Anaerolineaceae bacterium]
MLVVSNISKRYRGADEPILLNVSFTVNAGERVGLIGPNGCGKSTLINIVTGQIQPDRGSVQFNPPSLRVGYLPQGLTDTDSLLVRDVLFPGAGDLALAEATVQRLADAIAEASEDDLPGLLAAYGDALEQFERVSTGLSAGVVEPILAGLNLADVDLDSPVGMLSGGQKTRLGLASLLLSEPDLLVLDEPTNHLDITGLEWLEGWLRAFQGGALIVSHDRTFLDETITRLVALDDRQHTARLYEGNYSQYVKTVQSELDKQWAAWRDQQAEIARLQADFRQTMARAVRKENATKDSTQRRYAKKVASRAQAKKKRLERYMESEERVEKPIPAWPLRMGLLEDVSALPSDREIVILDQLAIGYEPGRPLLQDVTVSVMTGERIAVLGPNGQGKSTLLKTIIGELPPLSGTARIANSVQVGYLAQEQEILDSGSTPLETLLAAAPMSETEARTFLHFFLFSGDEVFRPVEQLSYGERACLMLAIPVAQGANLLILDEPINHLDVPARERFEQALRSYQGSVLAVVHDRYFVDRFATQIWHIEAGEFSVSFHSSIEA